MNTLSRLGVGLCNLPEEYYDSSANSNLTGIDEFGMITHSCTFHSWLLVKTRNGGSR